MEDLAQRLEMLLVLQWLDEGRRSDGTLRLSVVTAASELEAGEGRDGALRVMSALSDLEERGRVRVEIAAGGAREPVITLAEGLRRDAGRVFGGGPDSHRSL